MPIPRPNTNAGLTERFGSAEELTIRHRLDYVDQAAQAFIQQSPFLIVATADAEGRCDASPKGDPPGFVLVEDPHTLYLPDRPGNKMFQGISNVLENPHVGLLFMIPGEEWTLRINGKAGIVDAPQILERLGARGHAAQLAIRVTVEECFFHCPRSFRRAELWNHKNFQKYRGESWGTILARRTQLDESKAPELDCMIEEASQILD